MVTTNETKKTVTRRTPEQRIADLQSEIEKVKEREARQKVRSSDEGKALLAATRAVEKARKIAEAAGNRDVVGSLEAACVPLSAALSKLGMEAPATRHSTLADLLDARPEILSRARSRRKAADPGS